MADFNTWNDFGPFGNVPRIRPIWLEYVVVARRVLYVAASIVLSCRPGASGKYTVVDPTEGK